MQTKPGQYQAGDNNRQLGIADLNMETVLSGDNLLVVFQPLGVFNPRIGHATSSERATREKTLRASLESFGRISRAARIQSTLRRCLRATRQDSRQYNQRAVRRIPVNADRSLRLHFLG